MFRFLHEIRKEAVLAALFLAIIAWLPTVSGWIIPGPQPPGADWVFALLQSVAPAIFKLYLSVILTWGLMRLLFPTLADYASGGKFRADWAEPGRSTFPALTVAVMLALFAAALVAILWGSTLPVFTLNATEP